MQSITLILVCQLVGEGITRGLGLPVPGPVAGMVLMFSWLLARGTVSSGLSGAAGFLLGNLSLLFVPAGVGVVMHLGLLGRDWLPISLALLVSTLLAIAVTAWLMNRLGPIADRAGAEPSRSTDARGPR